MNTERNCQFCKYYKDGYCENLELKPCYPSKGCEDFRMCEVDVLDKIREEIDLLSDSECNGITVTVYSWNGMKKKVLDIIDKYKEESEE